MMRSARLIILLIALITILPITVDLGHSMLGQANQTSDQAARQEQLQRRKENFASGRQLLRDKGVPFEPEELLHDEWPKKLKAVLDGMPEMHDVRHETAPLKGAYIADTLYVPEKVQLASDTVILVNYLVFEGHNAVIKGPHNLYVFSRQPVGLLGTTLAAALQKKAGFLNVK